MSLILLFVFQFNIDQLRKNPRAIWIPLDAPAINLPLMNLKTGTVTNFETIGSEGITMILSSDCGACEKAFPILVMLSEMYPTRVIFAGKKDSVKNFLEKQEVNDFSHIYLVNPKDLVPYNIRTVPAVLGYENNKLTMAYCGPVEAVDFDRLVSLHENHSKIIKRK